MIFGSRLLPLSGVFEHLIHGVTFDIPFCAFYSLSIINDLNGGACRVERPKSSIISSPHIFGGVRSMCYVALEDNVYLRKRNKT